MDGQCPPADGRMCLHRLAVRVTLFTIIWTVVTKSAEAVEAGCSPVVDTVRISLLLLDPPMFTALTEMR